jgi:hypothetical protein
MLIQIGFGSISLVMGVLLKLLPCAKDVNAHQVVPMSGSEVNFTGDSYNKGMEMIELKVDDKGELFSLKREESSFT